MLVKIAILLDCTGSMEPWIYQAKTKIRDILEQNRQRHPNADFKVALVAYRDYGDLIRFRVTGFSNVNDIVDVLDTLRAEGGDDEAEDIAGGLYALWNLDGWDNYDLRLIFHIADAPAHGDVFHTPQISDRFPAGDPEGLDPREYIGNFAQREFDYTFVRITAKTDKMIGVFHEVYSRYGGRFRVIDLHPQSYDGRYGRVRNGNTSAVLGQALSEALTQTIDHYTSSQGM